jgi:hypothetical protein
MELCENNILKYVTTFDVKLLNDMSVSNETRRRF